MPNYNKTRAEQLLEQRAALPPEASPNVVRSVSQHRRDMLEEQFERGEIREQGEFAHWPEFRRFDEVSPIYRKRDESVGLSSMGRVASNSHGFRKQAQQALSGSSATSSGDASGSAWRGTNDTARQVPEVYSPLWLNSNLNLPRDRATINAWSRSFFALNPIVHNAITLHSTYPIAKMNIKCHNRRVEKFFTDMAEELDLMSICVQVAQEYWTLGEAFVFSELDDSTAKWSRLYIQNPDYMIVQRSVIAGEPIISLRPDENLRRIVFGQRPEDLQQRRQLDRKIIEHVKRGENIPFPNFNISHLARKISPYEIRGTGIIVNIFRQLMLLDKLRESKFAQADNMVNPLTLVKVGNDEFRPTPTDLDAWRQVFEASQYDKDFKIFTHNAVSVERVGYGQGIYDISGDIQQIIKEMWIGLMVPSVIMDGSDTTYATGSVSLDVLRQRYMQFRNILSSWLKRKVFAPISKLNEFYEYVEGDKVLIVPEIDWNHMSLFDMSDYIQNLSQLAQGEGPAKKVSLQTLYRSLGLDYDDEVRKVRYEDIQDAIRRKELMALDRFSLNDLRALGPNDEINEIEESPVPGESPYETPPPDMGGGMPGGGLPGLGGPPLGGMPPSAPVGRPPGIAPQPPGGGTGIGPGGVPKPPAPG